MDGLVGLAFVMIGLGYILDLERRLKSLETSANTGGPESSAARQRGRISQETSIKRIIAGGSISMVMFMGIHAYNTWVRWSSL